MTVAASVIVAEGFVGTCRTLFPLSAIVVYRSGCHIDAANSVGGMRNAARPEHHRQHQGTNEG